MVEFKVTGEELEITEVVKSKTNKPSLLQSKADIEKEIAMLQAGLENVNNLLSKFPK